MFSDSHCHFRHNPYDAVEPTVKRAEKAGVELALLAGIDIWSSEQEILTARRFGILKACVGIHPFNADLFNEEALRRLKWLVADEKVVAMSEIGLSYGGRRDRETREMGAPPIDKQIQREAFRGQLRAAKELDLPVIVHDGTPDEEILDILEEEGNTKVGVAIHGFNKNLAYAKRCVEMGVYISIGLGTVGLYHKNVTEPEPPGGPRRISTSEKEAFSEVIKQTDLKWLLTDSDRDNPEYVLEVAEKIAEMKGLTREDVGRQTTQNLRKLIRL